MMPRASSTSFLEQGYGIRLRLRSSWQPQTYTKQTNTSETSVLALIATILARMYRYTVRHLWLELAVLAVHAKPQVMNLDVS